MKFNFFFWIIALNLFYPLVNALIFELLPATNIKLIGIETTIFSIFFINLIIFLALGVTIIETIKVLLKKKVNKLTGLIVLIYLLFVCLQLFNFTFKNYGLPPFELGNKYYFYILYCLSSLILSIKFGNFFVINLINSKKFFFFIIFILTLVLIYIEPTEDNEIMERFSLKRLDPNSLIVYSGLILIYLYSKIYHLANTKNFSKTILVLFFVILSFYLIFKSNSAGILLSLASAFIFLVLLSLEKKIFNKIILFATIIIVFVLVNYNSLSYRFHSLIFDENSTLHTRINFYSYALSHDNLVNGFLIGTKIYFLDIYSFHNSLIELYYSGGFLLLALFTSSLLKILISYFKIIKLNNLIVDKFLISILLFSLLNSFIGGIFLINILFWSLLGIIISRLCYFRKKSFMYNSKY